MKTKLIRICIISLLQFSIQAQQADLSGIWTGKLSLPNTVKLTIVFHFQKDTDGKYTATMDSPDQVAKGIPTESVTINDDSIIVRVPSIMGSYEGKIITDSMKIDGKWKQGGMSLDLAVYKVDKVEEVKRPQEPKEPFPYKVEDVTFENKTHKLTLAGTLTMPKEGSNFPAVIMISGSGGQNRDEELLGHKPFLVIADYLTKNGYAVLRYDDRGIAKSTGDHSLATTEDFAADALFAVDYLKTRSEINHSKIGLIGHSEGGLIAPMAAVQSDDVSFIVLMAGPGIPGDSILYLQGVLIQRAEGKSEDEIAKSMSIQREVFQMIKQSDDDAALKSKLEEKFWNEYPLMNDDEKKQLGDPKVYVEMQIKTITSPWFKYFVKYDPLLTLEKVKCPVLAINGEKDLQVPPFENLYAIETALEKGGNKNYEIKMLTGLNHLFQTSKTGAISEYGQLEETISPLALEAMLSWLNKVVK
ncbi:MAG: alpha/beta hydrolase [Ignavibacteriaceae bacterium]|nr:alpha/beta hydrolase [Ignavibacteriaceae bacterium]